MACGCRVAMEKKRRGRELVKVASQIEVSGVERVGSEFWPFNAQSIQKQPEVASHLLECSQ